jgi:hypothetical protein
VWQEHLSPLLSITEAAGLRVVCKALKVLVRQWPVPIRDLDVEDLEAALRCFPATKELLIISEKPLAPAEECRLVEVLRGHAETLKLVRAGGESAEQLRLSAVRAGALPRLINFQFPFHIYLPRYRSILSEGMLRGLEEAFVWIKADDKEQVAALEHLCHLVHLQRLVLTSLNDLRAALPPFIPPSLKSLTLNVRRPAGLLRELSGVLQTSGASLETITASMYGGPSIFDDGGAGLGQVLCACSSTLKSVTLTGPPGRAVVPGLVSCCERLETLRCPWGVFSALPATCPLFPRLRMLHIEGYEVVDLASPGWDVMANGRVPALAILSIKSSSKLLGGQGEGRRRMARAFEAVAGTLRQLHLDAFPDHGPDRGWSPGACYEVGAAIGKLRCLRYLDLKLFSDGREYAAVGRGLAASGGCPALSRVVVDKVARNVEWLSFAPSLIVPSVEYVSIRGRGTEEEVLLLCCGLVQAGYKRGLDLAWLAPSDPSPALVPMRDIVRRPVMEVTACMRAIVRRGGMDVWMLK